MDQTLRRVAVIGGVRIPFCRSNTLYADQSNLDDADRRAERAGRQVQPQGRAHRRGDRRRRRHALQGLEPGARGGARHQAGAHHARHHHAAGLRHQPAGGHRSIAAKIATGEIESGIAMGSDTTSDAPIVFKEKFAHRLVEAQNAQVDAASASRLSRASRRASWRRSRPASSEPRTGLSMGQHTELMAQEWKISRAEQDQLAYESHKKAAEAYRSGYMDDLSCRSPACSATTTCARTSASTRSPR